MMNFPHLTEPLFISITYIFLRSLGFSLVLLSVGSTAIGRTAKISFSLLLVLWVMSGSSPSPGIWNAGSAVAELGLGVVVGLPSIILVQVCKMWGEMFDSGRGQSIGALYDPLLEGSAQVMSRCIGAWVVAALLCMGLLPQLLITLGNSFEIIPPGQLSLFDFITIRAEVLSSVLNSLSLGMLFFLPLGVSFLLVDIFVGFLSRLLPKFAIHAETFVLRTVIGFVVLAGSASSGLHWSLFEMAYQPSNQFIHMLSTVS